MYQERVRIVDRKALHQKWHKSVVCTQSWKSGTGNKYSTYQKQWKKFSFEWNEDPLHPYLNVLNFYTPISMAMWVTVSQIDGIKV